jgi:uncharacterized glyoxalase superfamily protein PhnB
MAVQPIPAGMHTVTPHLVVGGADKAIDFYKRAFDAKEQARMASPDGKIMHAEIVIGDSHVMLMDEDPRFKSVGPKTLKGSPVTIHLYVKDADKVFNKALDAGAKTIMPLEDTFWGDRYGVVQDPFGHTWAVATHQRDVSRAEMEEGAKSFRG